MKCLEKVQKIMLVLLKASFLLSSLKPKFSMMQEWIQDIYLEKIPISKLEVKGKINFHIYNAIYRDGPAIWVNDTLDRGQTNACATYGNPMLTFGEKGVDEQYEIHNVELFMIWYIQYINVK